MEAAWFFPRSLAGSIAWGLSVLLSFPGGDVLMKLTGDGLSLPSCCFPAAPVVPCVVFPFSRIVRPAGPPFGSKSAEERDPVRGF